MKIHALVPRCKEKNECFTVQPIKRLTASDEPIRMAKTKRSKRGRLTSEHDAPFIMHKDLVRTKAPAQMLIWHMSSVNQGGSFGGGYSGEIRNEMCALALEIHQALKQENATTGTQVGYKGKEIWSPERQFIGKGTFDFVFSRRNSRVFFFFFCFFFSKSILRRRRRDIARNAWVSHTHVFFASLSSLTIRFHPDSRPKSRPFVW